MLLLYLYACPHGNMIGCFVLPPEYISADMRWPSDRVSDRVSELVSNGFVDVCAETDLIRIRGWFGHNTIDTLRRDHSQHAANRNHPNARRVPQLARHQVGETGRVEVADPCPISQHPGTRRQRSAKRLSLAKGDQRCVV